MKKKNKKKTKKKTNNKQTNSVYPDESPRYEGCLYLELQKPFWSGLFHFWILDLSTDANSGFSLKWKKKKKKKKKKKNSVYPDETAHYEPSHLDLHCLQRYWFWSKTWADRVNSYFP